MFRYYFLASLLPSILTLDTLPEVAFWEFNELCRNNLNPQDLEKTKTIRRYIDIKNLRPFWQGKELDPHGNYTSKELDAHLLLEVGFPEYVFQFLRDHETVEERLDYFPKLLAQFYQEEIENADHFLKNFLIFERDWRLVLVALRAKAYQKDLNWELQHEDPFDDTIAYMLKQNELKDFTPPDGYEDLKVIYEGSKNDPLKLHWETGVWRLKKIQSFVEGGSFSIDNILSYLAQLIIVENWMKLSQEDGMSIVRNIMKEPQI